MKKGSMPILLGVGAAALFLSGGRKGRPVDCSGVGEKGGTVAGLRYIERIAGGADPNARLPMVIVFHSRAAKPESFLGWAANIRGPARVITPEGPGTLGSYRTWFQLPARTKDQETLDQQMRETGDIVKKFVLAITRCRPTVGKPVVVGTSQGGSMSFMMANLYPNLVHAAVPLAGWIPASMWNPRMAPTRALHGTEDTVVPYDRTAQYAQAMIDRGANLKLQSFPTGHNTGAGMGTEMRRWVNRILGYA